MIRKKNGSSRLAFGAALLTMVFGFAACGSALKDGGYGQSTGMTMDMAMPEMAAEEEYYDTSEGFTVESGKEIDDSAINNTARKLIKTVSLSVETKEFDSLLPLLQEKITALGGYIENMNSYNGSLYSEYRSNRYADITARIPVEHLKDFTLSVEENSNITQRSEQVEDVTLQYVDINSRKEMLRTEEKRLLQFLEQSETVEDMITIEARLSEVRYEIESIESRLRTYDNQVEYSTVDIHIEEVEVLSPQEKVQESAWERMSKGFMNNLEGVFLDIRDFFINIVIILPRLIFICLFGVAVFFVVRFFLRRKKKKTELINQAATMNGQSPDYTHIGDQTQNGQQ